MKNYKIIIAYDGAEYCGWQQQKGVPTVTQELQQTFLNVFGKQISLLGASRTDAGVHALGQVARFYCDMKIQPKKMLQAWNNLLPSDIVIKSVDSVPDFFNPHHDVMEKVYKYNFFLERPLPTVQRYGWYYRYPVDMQKLQTVLQVFVGTHNFRSFCTGDEREDTVRTINSVSVGWNGQLGAYTIEVRGPKFLRYMVRRIVGASLEVASRKHLTINFLREVLEEKNPEQTLPNAPAKGLILHSILYHT